MVDKRPIGYESGKPYFMDKKPPKNPKYAGVQPTLDTGFTAKNVEVISDKAIAKRKNEHFKRIKPQTLARLLMQEGPNVQESIYNLKNEKEEKILKEEENKGFDNQSVYSMMTHKSDASHMTSITNATDKIAIHDRSSFLLLDLREREDFDLFHIKESINYPAPNIGRDKFIPEMFTFKNSPGKIIVIYGLDERTQIPHATLLWQKGYENLYLLTGGVEDFLQLNPELVEGKKVPVLPKKQEKKVVILRSNYKENKNSGTESLPGLENKDLAVLFPKAPEDEASNSMSNLTNTNLNEKEDNKSTLSKKSSKNSTRLGFGSSTRK